MVRTKFSDIITYREHWGKIILSPNASTGKWDTFKDKRTYAKSRPVQIMNTRLNEDIKISTQEEPAPGKEAGSFIFLPTVDPIVFTVETQSQVLANGVSDFSVSMVFGFPKKIQWLVGAQISFFLRIQIDYDQPVVANPRFVADFTSCLRSATFLPIATTYSAKKFLYCIAVAGIAKPIQSIIDTVKLEFNWEWLPGVIASEPHLNQTVAMTFWGSGTATELTDVTNQIVPAWLFEDRDNPRSSVSSTDSWIGAVCSPLHSDGEWVSLE